MTPKELASKKIELTNRLSAMNMINIVGKTWEQLAEMELERIETQKKLFEIEQEIRKYIEGAY